MIFNMLGRATQTKGFLAAATVAAVACSLTSSAGAQAPAARGTAAQRLAIPRTADGKPDVSGVWAGGGFKHTEGAKYPDAPDFSRYEFKPPKDAFKPGGEALWTLKLNNDPRHDDPTLFCLPNGFPYIDLPARAQHFFQPPGYLVIAYEDDHATRIVPIGKSHPKGLDPTWYGNSVAHWEGDTLVVDVTGLKDWESDAVHHRHSEKAHYLEKYTRTGPTTMTLEIVTEDPEIFARPWSQTWEMHLRQDWEIFEDICEENNLDPGLVDYLKTGKK
jgi:hypothetical protein